MKNYVETENLKQQLRMEAALGYVKTLEDVEKIIDFCVTPDQPPADKWIPFTMEYDESGWSMLTCPLPEDGEEIIVTNGRYVWEDIFMNDGEECWLDSSNKALVEEVTAWQPKPEPYKGE